MKTTKITCKVLINNYLQSVTGKKIDLVKNSKFNFVIFINPSIYKNSGFHIANIETGLLVTFEPCKTQSNAIEQALKRINEYCEITHNHIDSLIKNNITHSGIINTMSNENRS